MPAFLDAPVLNTEELRHAAQREAARLIAGQLREKTMTVRNRVHSRIMVRSSYFLESWRE